MWSNETRLPIPPLDVLPNAQLIHGLTLLYLVLIGSAVTYALFHIRQPKGRLILLLLVAGCVTVLCEPILDVLGAAWYPHIGIPVAFELMGRPMPVWIVLAYTFFFGFVGSFTVLCFQHGMTRKQVWLLFMIPVVLDIVQQEIMVHYQMLLYYGNQPLVLIKFPLWWPPCDSFGNFLAATVAYRLLPQLKGWKSLALIVIYPLADFVGYAAVGVAGFNAVNSQFPNWVTQLCGLASWVLVIPLVQAIARNVAIDSPSRAAISAANGQASFAK